MLDKARDHPHEHLVAEFPHLIERHRAVCAEDVDLPSPVRPCAGIRGHEQDTPVLREPVPGENRRGRDAPRCRRGAEVLLSFRSSEPVPAVQDEPPLVERRRADAGGPAAPDGLRKVAYGDVPLVKPAEGGGRSEGNLRPAPESGVLPCGGMQGDLRTPGESERLLRRPGRIGNPAACLLVAAANLDPRGFPRIEHAPGLVEGDPDPAVHPARGAVHIEQGDVNP